MTLSDRAVFALLGFAAGLVIAALLVSCVIHVRHELRGRAECRRSFNGFDCTFTAADAGQE